MIPASAFEQALSRHINTALAEQALRLIQRSGSILLMGHYHPDPDAVGSALGLAFVLTDFGKSCAVLMPDEPDPGYAEFLPGFASVVTELPNTPIDLIIALDAGDVTRYGDVFTKYATQLQGIPIINIDHHITSQGFGDVIIIDPQSAATAELLTLLIQQLQFPLNKNAAQCLLAGIITDTRSFEFDATTARTLLAGSLLVSRGAVPQSIVKPMYRLHEFASARLLGIVLNTLHADCGGKLVWAEITMDMWGQAGLHPGSGDDGIPSYLVDVRGAQIAVLFRQTDENSVRVSVRTTNMCDATAITVLFSGGGHPRAAGCTLRGDLRAEKEKLLAAAAAHIAALK